DSGAARGYRPVRDPPSKAAAGHRGTGHGQLRGAGSQDHDRCRQRVRPRMRRVHRARGPQASPAIGAVGGDPPRDSAGLVGLHRRSRRAAVRRDQVAAGRRRLRAHTRTLPAVSYTHPSMRRTSDEIEYISRKIVKTLSAEGKFEMRSDEAIDALVRRKIESQKRPIVEGSDEWDVLYRKYYEEEVTRHRKVMP